jgi:RimK family alpha-L-glutamate ligase
MKLALLTQKNLECCNLFNSLNRKIQENNYPISVEKIYIEDIIIQWSNNSVQLLHNKKNILPLFDTFLFRFNETSLLEKTYSIAKTLYNNKKMVLNESYCHSNIHSNKRDLLNILEELRLPHPNSAYISNISQINTALDSFSFPLIIKDIYGWQGSSVYLVSSPKELSDIKKNLPKTDLLIQEYLPIEYDVRVIVIGYHAIGAMKRFAPENDFKTNLSSGGKAEITELATEMKDIAESLAKYTKNAILGIDFIIHNNKLLVLEIETCPGFQGFHAATNISVIDKILQYILHLQQSRIH